LLNSMVIKVVIYNRKCYKFFRSKAVSKILAI